MVTSPHVNITVGCSLQGQANCCLDFELDVVDRAWVILKPLLCPLGLAGGVCAHAHHLCCGCNMRRVKRETENSSDSRAARQTVSV